MGTVNGIAAGAGIGRGVAAARKMQEALAGVRLVVLSGPITGVPDYREHFSKWETYCLKAGARRVFNPTSLPQEWEYEELMAVCLMFVRKADLLFQMPGWRESPGAQREHTEALRRGVNVMEVRT